MRGCGQSNSGFVVSLTSVDVDVPTTEVVATITIGCAVAGATAEH